MSSQNEGLANGGHERAAASSTTDRLAEKAHETVDRVAERSAPAERELREQARKASERVRETEAKARDFAGDSARQLESYIERNPIMGAGVAFLAGLVVSTLLRR
jgi:ElaB/YqjD/DUF883 family membrane-anchored ribosome-binding protein